MGFLHGNALSEAIRKIASTGSADMAVAFWGGDVCERLQIPSEAKGSRIACDARSGACNPSGLADLLDRKASIVDVPGLHAKVYIGRNQAVIASANASANGLGEEGNDVAWGLEAGYWTGLAVEVNAAREWFEAAYKCGTPIAKSELPEIRALWDQRRRHRPSREAGSAHFFDVLFAHPTSLSGRGIKIGIFRAADTAPPSVEKKYRRSPFYDKSNYDRQIERHGYPYYWDAKGWKINVGDYILGFGVDDAGIGTDGICRVQALIDNGAIIPIEYVKNPFGLKFPRRDEHKLEKCVEYLIHSGHLQVDGPLISVENFVQALQMLQV
jgi:hypothetical protein